MKELNALFLNDIAEDRIDAVIITTCSAKEVQERINEVKRELECEWCWDDIVNALSNDCMIFDRWSEEYIYY